VAKDELFDAADVVTTHYKLSPRSQGIVGAREIGLMKPTAYLVNTSRGPLVDTDALRAGAIAGAALDVYDEEPLPADIGCGTCRGRCSLRISGMSLTTSTASFTVRRSRTSPRSRPGIRCGYSPALPNGAG
jgi:lactate dehydrogenase-like 2-hydroxyacid dehydrogenase